MVTYRITERDRRFIVGTEQEAILICRSLEIAHQAVADAELLETMPAKLIFARRVAREGDEREEPQRSRSYNSLDAVGRSRPRRTVP